PTYYTVTCLAYPARRASDLNFDGFYRSDNGQSDPAISSLFDLPTNDPSYTAIGVPQFGFGGDIRFQGTTLGEGVLPNDRPHQVKDRKSTRLNSSHEWISYAI